ncbi:carboxymuconolactone decarboxylase family protein [Alcaligenaceae bacterium]|nr:carboxymuconolactone decarboxylase family protein [Alcaligenaceae bacterium]
MTVTSYKALTQQIAGNLVPLNKAVPQVMQSFAEMGKAANKNGALDHKTKELIALAIGVAVRCDGCIGFHTKALAKLGATPEEVHETLGVAVYMGGGPSVMYAANAVAAFNEFTDAG